MKRNVINYLYSFLAKANVKALEYNSRIMHVHDIIEIATSLEKKSDPHEVAGGLLHRNKIKESVWIETMRRNSFKTTATLAFIVFCVGCTEVREI